MVAEEGLGRAEVQIVGPGHALLPGPGLAASALLPLHQGLDGALGDGPVRVLLVEQDPEDRAQANEDQVDDPDLDRAEEVEDQAEAVDQDREQGQDGEEEAEGVAPLLPAEAFARPCGQGEDEFGPQGEAEDRQGRIAEAPVVPAAALAGGCRQGRRVRRVGHRGTP